MRSASQRVQSIVVSVCLLVPAAAYPATGAVVFREVETLDFAGGQTRQVRESYAAGDGCKLALREGGDNLAPVDSYVLANASDAWLVDPGRRVVMPLDPIDMLPVADASGDTPVVTISDISLVSVADEAGPKLLGLPTRRYVYHLRYLEHTPPATAMEGVYQWEERHEFWATPWPGGADLGTTWRRLRIVDDAGRGRAAPEMRAALERMQQHGLMLRQIILREKLGGPGGTALERERVDREVVEIAHRDLSAVELELPSGYARAEFLAPAPDEPASCVAPMSIDCPMPMPATEPVTPVP